MILHSIVPKTRTIMPEKIISISLEERAAFEKYIANPIDYIHEQHTLLFPGNKLPDGAKIARSGRWNHYEENDSKRCFVIPSLENQGEDIEIAFSREEATDPKIHSCTVINEKRYFHQNKYDFIKSQEFYDKDGLEEEASDDEIAFDAPDYYKNGKKNGIGCVVKRAVDEAGKQYVLKSVTFFSRDVALHATHSFFGDSVIRRTGGCTSEEDAPITKIVTFMPDAGKETLGEFLDRLSQTKKKFPLRIQERIAYGILLSFSEQIYDRGIIHRDINSCNLCSNHWGKREQVITFIDYEEASFVGEKTNSLIGRGKAGYLGAEFFKTIEGCRDQEQIRVTQGENAFVQLLKPNYQQFFSQASDICALGHVLEELHLPENSPFDSLSRTMRADNPEERPTGAAIAAFLNAYLHCNTISQPATFAKPGV